LPHSHFKDYFSNLSDHYASFRPTYPQELFEWLAEQTAARNLCWDCATGTGQAAQSLFKYFHQVIATDASQTQLASAIRQAGIEYRLAKAEQSGLDSESVDLITVAQALHWFNIPAFMAEADRVLKPQGVLAIVGYQLLRIRPDIDRLLTCLYQDVLGDFWPAERKLVETGYAGIAFPFSRLAPPSFSMQAFWTLPQLLGYLSTWSAVKQYQAREGKSALEIIYQDLEELWGDSSTCLRITWPLTLLVGKKRDS